MNEFIAVRLSRNSFVKTKEIIEPLVPMFCIQYENKLIISKESFIFMWSIILNIINVTENPEGKKCILLPITIPLHMWKTPTLVFVCVTPFPFQIDRQSATHFPLQEIIYIYKLGRDKSLNFIIFYHIS